MVCLFPFVYSTASPIKFNTSGLPTHALLINPVQGVFDSFSKIHKHQAPVYDLTTN